MKKRIIIFIIIAAIVFSAVLFIVLNTRQRAFHRGLERDLPEYAELVNYTYYFEGFTLYHVYEFTCGEDDLDALIKHLGSDAKLLLEYSDDTDYIREKAETVGYPKHRYWLDTEKESVIGWDIGLVGSEYILTHDTDGDYHVYYEWLWYPGQAFVK